MALNPRTPAATHGCESCHGPGQAHVDDDNKGNIRKFGQRVGTFSYLYEPFRVYDFAFDPTVVNGSVQPSSLVLGCVYRPYTAHALCSAHDTTVIESATEFIHGGAMPLVFMRKIIRQR